MYCSQRSTVKGEHGPVFERIDERNMAVYTGVDKGETMSALHIVNADGHIREDVSEISGSAVRRQEVFLPTVAG